MIWVLMATLHLFMVAGFADGGGFPAMFIFGDSALDPGNNNNLWTTAKANFFPNGIDFPGGPTGRFCNGFTMADYLGTHRRIKQMIINYSLILYLHWLLDGFFSITMNEKICHPYESHTQNIYIYIYG